ncbi:hypothetical protein JCM11251_001767 [Rhodosporidiobolus azoricus]
MLSLARAVRLNKPSRTFGRPLVNSFSSSTSTAKGSKVPDGRTVDTRRRGSSPPPRPPNPSARRPVHRTKPHTAVDVSASNLFRTRTKWISQSLAEGKHFPRDLLLRLLDSRDIPPAQVALWVDVLARRDPVYALQRLGLLESATSSEEVPTQSSSNGEDAPPVCPQWLYLSLPAMVTSPSHVPYLASQLLSPHFLSLDEQNRGLFVSRCIQHFLEVRHYVALREIVEWVAYTPAPPFQPTGPAVDPSTAGLCSTRSFSRLLSALASERIPSTRASATPPSILQPLVTLLRSTMTARQVPQTLDTFLPLFSPKLIPREPVEALKVVREMRYAGLEPGKEVLHRVMSVCARAGQTKLVEALRVDIEGLQGRKGERGSSSPAMLGSLRSSLLRPGAGAIDEVDRSRTRPLDEAGVGAWEAGQASAPGCAEGEDEGWADVPGEEAQEQQWTLARRRTEQRRLHLLKLPDEALFEAQKVVGLAKEPAFLRTLGLTTAVEEEDRQMEAKDLPSASRAEGEGEPGQDGVRSGGALHPPREGAADHDLQGSHSSPLPSTDVYGTTTLLDPAISLVYYDTLRTYLDANMRSISFPAPPFKFDNPAWATFLSAMGRSPSVPTSSIIEILRRLELVSSSAETPRSGYTPPKPDIRVYTAVLRTLLRRHAPQQALSLWRSLERRGWRPDAAMLDCTVRAFCAIGKSELARRHLDFYGHRLGVDPPELLVSDRAQNPKQSAVEQGLWRRSVRLDVVPFNSLLASLTRVGEYDAAYALFRDLEDMYGVKPDVATLSIMLDAARYCSAAAGKGFGPGFEDLSSLAIREPGSRSGFGSIDHSPTGRRSARTVVDDRWDGVPAATRMERFLWHDVLGANWQDANVQDPLYARWDRDGVRAGGKGGLTGWIADRLGGTKQDGAATTSSASRPTVPSPPPDWRPFASTLSPAPPSYPHFHPTDRVFRSLIQLVGYHGHPSTIPLLTSWMSHLGVVPSRWTLALALMYVEGESSISPARVDRWRSWLGAWLGKEAVPTEREVAWVRRGGRAEGDPELR